MSEKTPFNADWKRGFEDGRSHAKPSGETMKMFQALHEDLNDIKDDIKFIKSSFTELDKRSVTWDYSSKGFFAMLGLVVTSFFVAVINFFIK